MLKSVAPMVPTKSLLQRARLRSLELRRWSDADNDQILIVLHCAQLFVRWCSCREASPATVWHPMQECRSYLASFDLKLRICSQFASSRLNISATYQRLRELCHALSAFTVSHKGPLPATRGAR